MSGTFGTPAPLPGQSGYKPCPTSETMAQETAEMEERLVKLRTDMIAETHLREASCQDVGGGSHWRSACPDRGSVRSYAKDVKERQQKQQYLRHRKPGGRYTKGPHAGAGARAATGLREEKGHGVPRGAPINSHGQRVPVVGPSSSEVSGESNFPRTMCTGNKSTGIGNGVCNKDARKDVSLWGVGDTIKWLESLELGQYREIFQKNEISGPILLEVGMDDLDYMSINILAHRKVILKGIEHLKRDSCRPDLPPPAPEHISVNNEPQNHSARSCAPSWTADSVHFPQDPSHTSILWSQVKPLTDIMVGSGDVPQPSSKLAHGEYDEHEAHKSFTEAVMAWRRSKGGGEGTLCTSGTSLIGDKWMAKSKSGLGLTRWAEDEEHTCDEREGADIHMWTNPFDSPQSKKTGDMKSAHPDFHSPPSDAVFATSTTEISTESLDEEAEHEAFRRAVEYWRGINMGGTAFGVGKPGDTGSGKTTSTEPITPLRRAEVLAESLRKKMDEDHQVTYRSLEEHKLRLQEGLEKAQRERGEEEAVRLRLSSTHTETATAETASIPRDSDDDNRSCLHEVDMEWGGDYSRRVEKEELKDEDGEDIQNMESLSTLQILSPSLSTISSSTGCPISHSLRYDQNSEGSKLSGAEAGTIVGIELVESMLGSTSDERLLGKSPGGVEYLVEEGNYDSS
ncbi:unnamed protein product [Choristocarpus tenellus]